MTPTEIRFNILKLAQYDKTAAEIMVDFVKDDETRYNLYVLAFENTAYMGQQVTERASSAKDAAEIMVAFTGKDNADKYQLYTQCFSRTSPNTDVKSRAVAASDEASKLYSIFEL
jgi:hypothetical protein